MGAIKFSQTLRAVCLYGVAAFFAGMGLVGLADPLFTVHFFGNRSLTPDMRNEVRAVYGGFGIAIAALLLYTKSVDRRRPAYALGIRTAVMVSLAGMAAGRLVSFALERTTGPHPAMFLVIELGLSAMLYVSMPESGLTAT